MRVAITVLLLLCTGCGSRRVAGYLAEYEDGADWTGGAESSGSSGGSSGSGTTAADGSGTAGETGGTSGTDGMTGAEGTTSAETTEGGGETTGTSTGEPTPVCGNGAVEAFGATPEECDDGNVAADDGCSDTCALDRRVFVTSVRYQAGELQSLTIADALCGNLADDQGFPDALKYRAWLSDSATDARDRFKRGRGRLVMVNGLVLSASWSALLAGELQNPFEVTETSETYHGAVWTGTRPDGTLVPGAANCDDWASSWYKKTGYYGYSDRTTAEWTLSALWDNPSACISSYAVYCLQSL